MRLLLISPLAVPINDKTKYSGIERLVWTHAQEFIAQGHQVGVWGHTDSVFPEGVTLYSASAATYDQAEYQCYRLHQASLRQYDAIIDFSHLHLASRMIDNLPSLNIIWHAPALAKYPKAPYNIICPSNWGVREFKRVYGQDARALRVIAIDAAEYHPNGDRGDRFFCIGRNDPEKGNLNAIMVCKKAGVPLDIIAARGMQHGDAPLTEYEQAVMDNCDGKTIRFLGDLGAAEKIKVMQQARGLVYITEHPEITSHKDQEAMMCGTPAVVTAIGAAGEIVEEDVNGNLIRNERDVMTALKTFGDKDWSRCSATTTATWRKEEIIKTWLPLLQEVAQGLRW